MDNDIVKIELSSKQGGKLRIRGEGSSGWYTEIQKTEYDGPDLVFYIDPTLLKELISKHNECLLNAEHMKMISGKFTFVTCLGTVEED